MESRISPPQWRAVESEVHPGRWLLEQNIGGIWSALTANTVVHVSLYTEQDAKLLAASPELLTALVGLNTMMTLLRETMSTATSMRHIRDAANDDQLLAFLSAVRKLVADTGGPRL